MIEWLKGDFTALELEADRSNGQWAPLSVTTITPYTDPTNCPAAGAVWRYRGIYQLNGVRVGQWSAIVTLPVCN